MADVFFSYAREDRTTVDRLEAAFNALNWTTWSDRHIRPGESFRSVIKKQIQAASAVVVLWSAHSLDAEFVHDEAELAKELGLLVPVVIDGSKPPLGFGQRNAISLIGWDGTRKSDGYDDLVAEIVRRIKSRNPPAATPPAASGPLRAPVLKARESGLLTWMPVSGATSYEVQRGGDEDFLGPSESIWEGDDLAYGDPALALSPVVSPTGRWRSTSSFYYRVRARRGDSPGDLSEWSNAVLVTSK